MSNEKKIKINKIWFERLDKEGRKLSSFLKELNNYEVFCKCCVTSFNVIHSGYAAIQRHIESKKHETNIKIVTNPNQMQLCFGNSTSTSSSDPPRCEVKLFSPRDPTTRAELLLLMKKISNNESLSSCDHLSGVLKAAFPDSKIVEQFSLERSKAAYLVTYAIGPYFRELLLKDINTNFMYCLLYDETTNDAKKKELQVSIRFFSEKYHRVEFHHLETFFLGAATGEIIVANIKAAIDNANLPLSKLIALGMDGPNVNKNVERRLSEELVGLRGKGVLKIGQCNLHVVHNAFKKGLQAKGSDVVDLIVQTYNWFDGFASRSESFQNYCHEKKLIYKTIMKHVPSRWLTLGPAAERFLEIFDSIKSYFLKHLPSQKKFQPTIHYRNIVTYLKQEDIKLELLLIIESARTFEPFLEIFQMSEPMIHLLYSKMVSLVKLVTSKVCKNIKNDITISFEDSNIKTNAEIELSNKIDETTMNLKFNEINRQLFVQNYKNHFVQAGKYLVEKTNCNLPILEGFQCLDPEKVNDKNALKFIKNILKLLPESFFVEDKILDEYRLLQLEKIDTVDYDRIDDFWAKCFENNRWPNLSKFIKSVICISHGQGDVERRFSNSGNVLTNEKTNMSVRTLNARLNANDGIHRFGKQIENIPIDKNFLNMANSARSNYRLYLDDEKKKKALADEQSKKEKEQNEQQKNCLKRIKEMEHSVQNYESKMKEREDNLAAQQKLTDALLSEASEKLNACISKNDLIGAKVAQALYNSALKEREKEKIEMDAINKLKRKKNDALKEISEKRQKIAK